jgi:hypothetical protein
LPADYLTSPDRPTELAEDIARDGVEVLCVANVITHRDNVIGNDVSRRSWSLGK